MAKNKMKDLRDHLFETIERLKDPEENDKMDLETAKTINDIASTLVQSAKVEATLMMHFDRPESEFIPVDHGKLIPAKSGSNGER